MKVLEYVLKTQGISQTDIARDCGVVKQNVNKWCKYRDIPQKYNNIMLKYTGYENEFLNMKMSNNVKHQILTNELRKISKGDN